MRRPSRPSGGGVRRPPSRSSQMNRTAAPPLRNSSFATEEFLPYLLNQITNLSNRNFKIALKRSPVNVRQFRVLAVLFRLPGLSLTELVEKTAIDQPTLSRMVDQLSALGLLKRETARNDGRLVRLSLTASGERLIEDLWPVAWKHYRIGVVELTQQEEASLIKLLKRVLDSLQAV
jgi:DNA-binding MarR family transcriptional regulator